MTTTPTDALLKFRDTIFENKGARIWPYARRATGTGEKVRALLKANGFSNVAAPGFEAPCVVVSFTDDPGIQNGSKFAAEGMQIAAGVPLQCEEGEGWSTFRLGLFWSR